MAALPTGTVTFLFTDIEGSTTLLQRLGDRRCAEILEKHHACSALHSRKDRVGRSTLRGCLLGGLLWARDAGNGAPHTIARALQDLFR